MILVSTINNYIIRAYIKFFNWLPDKYYLTLLYFLKMHRCLNLKDPKRFSEKIQLLKIIQRTPNFTMMVDKYVVKEYVANKIGSEYIIKTLGIWNRPEDVDFEMLPSKFVLKTTHGAGGGPDVFICKDKSKCDKEYVISSLSAAYNQNSFKRLREWPYENVPHRVIAEEYVEDEKSGELPDYKFFCFNGIPYYCQVITGRCRTMTVDFFDMNWKHTSFQEPANYPNSNKIIQKPMNFEMMKELAAKLSIGYPFIRVDFYEANGKLYFGELTFYPTSGFGRFSPDSWDVEFGNLLKINTN